MKRHNPGCLCCRNAFYFYGITNRVNKACVFRHQAISLAFVGPNNTTNQWGPIFSTTMTAAVEGEPDKWAYIFPTPWKAHSVLGGEGCCYAIAYRDDGNTRSFKIAKINQYSAELEWEHAIPHTVPLSGDIHKTDPYLISANKDYVIFAYVNGKVDHADLPPNTTSYYQKLVFGRADDQEIVAGEISEDLYSYPNVKNPHAWKFNLASSQLGITYPYASNCVFTNPDPTKICPSLPLSWTEGFGNHCFSDAMTRLRIETSYENFQTQTFQTRQSSSFPFVDTVVKSCDFVTKYFLDSGHIAIANGGSSFSGGVSEPVITRRRKIADYSAINNSSTIGGFVTFFAAKESDRGRSYLVTEFYDDTTQPTNNTGNGRLVGITTLSGFGGSVSIAGIYQPVRTRDRYVNEEFGENLVATYATTGYPQTVLQGQGIGSFPKLLLHSNSPFGDSCEILEDGAFNSPPKKSMLHYRETIDSSFADVKANISPGPGKSPFNVTTFYEHYCKGPTNSSMGGPSGFSPQQIATTFGWPAYVPKQPQGMPIEVGFKSGSHSKLYLDRQSEVVAGSLPLWGTSEANLTNFGPYQGQIAIGTTAGTGSSFVLNLPQNVFIRRLGNGRIANSPVWNEDSLHSPRPHSREVWEDINLPP